MNISLYREMASGNWHESGITKGWNLYECGKFANAVGTHCVMAAGASTGIKSLEEILKFMEDNEIGV